MGAGPRPPLGAAVGAQQQLGLCVPGAHRSLLWSGGRLCVPGLVPWAPQCAALGFRTRELWEVWERVRPGTAACFRAVRPVAATRRGPGGNGDPPGLVQT